MRDFGWSHSGNATCEDTLYSRTKHSYFSVWKRVLVSSRDGPQTLPSTSRENGKVHKDKSRTSSFPAEIAENGTKDNSETAPNLNQTELWYWCYQPLRKCNLNLWLAILATVIALGGRYMAAVITTSMWDVFNKTYPLPGENAHTVGELMTMIWRTVAGDEYRVLDGGSEEVRSSEERSQAAQFRQDKYERVVLDT
ncbi:hypothetical protein EDD18DRAFT_1111359 [Armillaria luteobubalina]|uniref:Uncharacterized protein n=1 Tax=Armillaria luteobubalina TaxID=153913 RepID=A0AA39UFW5_9AGAR|nr:hypothetical protein EDD18DRAFT_1111359 [Armillaria luteobubalina]